MSNQPKPCLAACLLPQSDPAMPRCLLNMTPAEPPCFCGGRAVLGPIPQDGSDAEVQFVHATGCPKDSDAKPAEPSKPALEAAKCWHCEKQQWCCTVRCCNCKRLVSPEAAKACERCGKTLGSKIHACKSTPAEKGEVDGEIEVRMTFNGEPQTIVAPYRKGSSFRASVARVDAYVPKSAYLALRAEVDRLDHRFNVFDSENRTLRAELAAAEQHVLTLRDQVANERGAYERVSAELAAIKAQAEDATEYVLAVENRELRAELATLRIRVREYEDMTEIDQRFAELEAERDALAAEVERLRGEILQECAEAVCIYCAGRLPEWAAAPKPNALGRWFHPLNETHRGPDALCLAEAIHAQKEARND